MYFFIDEVVINWVSVDLSWSLDLISFYQVKYDDIVVEFIEENFDVYYFNRRKWQYQFTEGTVFYKNQLKGYIFHVWRNNFWLPLYTFYLKESLTNFEALYMIREYSDMIRASDRLDRFSEKVWYTGMYDYVLTRLVLVEPTKLLSIDFDAFFALDLWDIEAGHDVLETCLYGLFYMQIICAFLIIFHWRRSKMSIDEWKSDLNFFLNLLPFFYVNFYVKSWLYLWKTLNRVGSVKWWRRPPFFGYFGYFNKFLKNNRRRLKKVYWEAKGLYWKVILMDLDAKIFYVFFFKTLVYLFCFLVYWISSIFFWFIFACKKLLFFVRKCYVKIFGRRFGISKLLIDDVVLFDFLDPVNEVIYDYYLLYFYRKWQKTVYIDKLKAHYNEYWRKAQYLNIFEKIVLGRQLWIRFLLWYRYNNPYGVYNLHTLTDHWGIYMFFLKRYWRFFYKFIEPYSLSEIIDIDQLSSNFDLKVVDLGVTDISINIKDKVRFLGDMKDWDLSFILSNYIIFGNIMLLYYYFIYSYVYMYFLRKGSNVIYNKTFFMFYYQYFFKDFINNYNLSFLLKILLNFLDKFLNKFVLRIIKEIVKFFMFFLNYFWSFFSKGSLFYEKHYSVYVVNFMSYFRLCLLILMLFFKKILSYKRIWMFCMLVLFINVFQVDFDAVHWWFWDVFWFFEGIHFFKFDVFGFLSFLDTVFIIFDNYEAVFSKSALDVCFGYLWSEYTQYMYNLISDLEVKYFDEIHRYFQLRYLNTMKMYYSLIHFGDVDKKENLTKGTRIRIWIFKTKIYHYRFWRMVFYFEWQQRIHKYYLVFYKNVWRNTWFSLGVPTQNLFSWMFIRYRMWKYWACLMFYGFFEYYVAYFLYYAMWYVDFFLQIFWYIHITYLYLCIYILDIVFSLHEAYYILYLLFDILYDKLYYILYIIVYHVIYTTILYYYIYDGLFYCIIYIVWYNIIWDFLINNIYLFVVNITCSKIVILVFFIFKFVFNLLNNVLLFLFNFNINVIFFLLNLMCYDLFYYFYNILLLFDFNYSDLFIDLSYIEMQFNIFVSNFKIYTNQLFIFDRSSLKISWIIDLTNSDIYRNYLKYDILKYIVYVDMMRMLVIFNQYIYGLIPFEKGEIIIMLKFFEYCVLDFFLLNDYIAEWLNSVHYFISLTMLHFGPDSLGSNNTGTNQDYFMFIYQEKWRGLIKATRMGEKASKIHPFTIISVLNMSSSDLHKYDLFNLINFESTDFVYAIYYCTKYYILALIIFGFFLGYIARYEKKKSHAVTDFYFRMHGDFKKISDYTLTDYMWITDLKMLKFKYDYQEKFKSRYYTLSDSKWDLDTHEEIKVAPVWEKKEDVYEKFFKKVSKDFLKGNPDLSFYREYRLLERYWKKRFVKVKAVVDYLHSRWVRANYLVKKEMGRINFMVPPQYVRNFYWKKEDWYEYLEDWKAFRNNFVLEYLFFRHRDGSFYKHCMSNPHLIEEYFPLYKFMYKEDIKSEEDFEEKHPFLLYSFEEERPKYYGIFYKYAYSKQQTQKYLLGKYILNKLWGSVHFMKFIDFKLMGQDFHIKVLNFYHKINDINEKYFNRRFMTYPLWSKTGFLYEKTKYSEDELFKMAYTEGAPVEADPYLLVHVLDTEIILIWETYNYYLKEIIKKSTSFSKKRGHNYTIFNYDFIEDLRFSWILHITVSMFIFVVKMLWGRVLKRNRADFVKYNCDLFVCFLAVFLRNVNYNLFVDFIHIKNDVIRVRKAKKNKRKRFARWYLDYIMLLNPSFSREEYLYYSIIYSCGSATSYHTSLTVVNVMLLCFTWIDLFAFCCLLIFFTLWMYFYKHIYIRYIRIQ